MKEGVVLWEVGRCVCLVFDVGECEGGKMVFWGAGELALEEGFEVLVVGWAVYSAEILVSEV